MGLNEGVSAIRKILNAIPSLVNPVLIRGQKQRWRDDFSGNSLSSNWSVVQVGNGQSITVSNSELKIATGIAVGETIIRHKKPFTIPCKVVFIGYLTQRIANQSFYLEIVDATGSNYARFFFAGTSSLNVSAEQLNNASPSSGFANLSNSSTTFSSGVCYEIDANVDELKFSTRDALNATGRSASFTQYKRIPDPSSEYFIQIRVANTAPTPSSSTLVLDSVSIQENEIFTTEIVSGRGAKTVSDSVAVNVINGSSILVSGSVSVSGSNVYTTETTTPLAANASASLGTRDANNKISVIVTIQTDQPGNVFVDQSADNNTWLDYGAKACTAGINTFSIQLNFRYFRIRYVNGATAQGVFRCYSYQKSI